MMINGLAERIVLDGAGPRRKAVLQALLRLGAGADAEGIADALERYIHGLMRRTGVRWRAIWIDRPGRFRVRLVTGPQATAAFRASRGRWEQKRLAAGTRLLIAQRRWRQPDGGRRPPHGPGVGRPVPYQRPAVRRPPLKG